MARITLRKALNKKNKLIGRIKELEAHIARNFNKSVQYVDGQALSCRQMDITKEYKELFDTKNKLVLLKSALAKANVGIYEKIYHIAELKADITWLRGLNTVAGKSVNEYGDKTYITESTPFKSAEEVMAMIKYDEGMIEAFQEQIDEFNSVTFIEFDD